LYLKLREEPRLRVFQNRMLRRIFGSKRDEVMGQWKMLHNGVLHILYSSPDIIRQRIRWVEHKARNGGGQKLLEGFGGIARKKKTTWKIKAYMRGRDLNGL
jgi:hypothetical protein